MVEAVLSRRVPEALGQSDAFSRFQEDLSRVARVDRPVLIVGERGTGKELAAARLHYLSARWQGPLVSLNCAALTPALIESELFGVEQGAYTGAVRRRAGRFEAADGGTLFLDEIGLIPLEVQEKVLRAVEYKQFERLGSAETVEVNTRIVGAANVDLRRLAERGRFKRDLLDRLAFEVVTLPPLRRREGDILLLAGHFAARMASELGLGVVPELRPQALKQLESYAWPGNIRELKNVIERAVCRSGGAPITDVVLDPFASEFPLAEDPVAQPVPPPTTSARHQDSSTAPIPEAEVGPIKEELPDTHPWREGRSLSEVLEAVELNALRAALLRAGSHQGRAARLLGLSYHQFRGLYRKHRDQIHPETDPA